MADRLLTIRECAEKLGISQSQLRELARQGQLPASKQAGRWLVQASAIENITPLKRGVRRVRGRLAEAVALDDLTHRLLGRGKVVSAPTRRGNTTPERAAEAAAIQHQLDPASRHREPVAVPQGLKGRARAAQSKNLEHLEDRLDKPHPPERSL